MRDVVICKPLRTPVGRFGGVFRDLDANTLATGLLTALVERTGLTGADVDDVVLGQGSPNGEGPAIGRIAALDSPLGIDVPGIQLDRRCGSGLQAIITGALQVLASWAVAGVAPETMGIGPVPATAKALDRLDLTLADMDVIELNEAFAAQALSVMREWDIDPTSEHLNPHGCGISLGHPVGATGARMLATLSREMVRRDAQWGLETMCIGGGQGLAAVFERV